MKNRVLGVGVGMCEGVRTVAVLEIRRGVPYRELEEASEEWWRRVCGAVGAGCGRGSSYRARRGAEESIGGGGSLPAEEGGGPGLSAGVHEAPLSEGVSCTDENQAQYAHGDRNKRDIVPLARQNRTSWLSDKNSSSVLPWQQGTSCAYSR